MDPEGCWGSALSGKARRKLHPSSRMYTISGGGGADSGLFSEEEKTLCTYSEVLS